MNIDIAPSIETAHDDEDDEAVECPHCTHERPYVRYDGDTVCQHCGYVRGSDSVSRSASSTPQPQWSTWWNHRSSEYDGWYGRERVRMVGGFAAAYDY
jgi:DNA-directed RNA polymerase subunit RPC12/RpoP